MGDAGDQPVASTSSPTVSVADDHLVRFLATELERKLFGAKRQLSISVLRSSPRRSHSLFPWATLAREPPYRQERPHVFVEDILVALCERDREQADVPSMGLEASLYTIPATSTCLLYVAKVDTTGLISYSKELSSPARELTRAFLAYHFARPPRGMKRLRVHIFGRAADQYLFPLSADNKGKKVLDDRRLCAWWKSVLSESAPASAERYYLFPGFTELEATRIAPQDTPAWTYGHPYSATSSPLYTTMHVTPLSEASPSPSASSDLVLTVGDLIPNFSDDPKGRYTRSLAQSRAENVGDVGDYDDVVRKAEKASNAALAKLQHDRLERDLSSERARLANVQLDQWWENMAFRQECSGGRICAFFVVVQDEPVDIVPPESRIDPLAGSVAHNVYTTLWQKMHDIDYSSREEAVAKIHDWQAAVSKACDSDTSAICRSITIDRARPDKSEDLKRSAPVAAVTKLMPRKKLKPAAA